MEAWDESSARAVVTSLVLKRVKAKHFIRFPELGKEDLISEGLIAARRSWPNFDPARSAASTWITRVATCRIIDLLRSANRRVHRETAFATLKPGLPPGAGDDADTPEDLAEWLGNIHRMIRRNFGTYRIPLKLEGRRGRPMTYDRAQAAALLALKKRKNLTCRGMVFLLETNPRLAAAIGLPHLPSFMFFSRVESSVTQISFSPARLAS